MPSGTTGAPNAEPRKRSECEAPSSDRDDRRAAIALAECSERQMRWRRGTAVRRGCVEARLVRARPTSRSAEVTTIRFAATSSARRRRTASTASGTTAPEATRSATGASAGSSGVRRVAARAGGSRRRAPGGATRPRRAARERGSASAWSTAGRQPQVRPNPLVGAARRRSRLRAAPRRLARRSRLAARQVRQLDADRGGDRRLVRAALGRQRDAGRRAGEDELRPM